MFSEKFFLISSKWFRNIFFYENLTLLLLASPLPESVFIELIDPKDSNKLSI